MSLRRAPDTTAATGRDPGGREPGPRSGAGPRSGPGTGLAGCCFPPGRWPSPSPWASSWRAVADQEPPTARTAAPAADTPFEQIGTGDLARGVTGLQAHLRARPKDARGWATLGAAYVEQARTSGDPTRYPQADKALPARLHSSRGTTTRRSPAVPHSRRRGTTSTARCASRRRR